MKIIRLDEIKKALQNIDIIPAIEQGFIAYSKGQAVVPPVGELLFDKPPGEVHIKYGYIKNDPYYVIKIASGFYENNTLGLSSTHGLMLIFSQKTGHLLGILLDEGYLTNLRTAAAGAIAAKYLAPKQIRAIGIVGTGLQAHLQLTFLKQVTNCKRVFVWGRNLANAKKLASQFTPEEFQISATDNIIDITSKCNLIVTTTPSSNPLLFSKDILPGTHITAVGADTVGKQELDSEILQRADILVADSISQCKTSGEIAYAIKQNPSLEEKIIELGDIIACGTNARRSAAQISVADLTGVAVQDIQIAKLVFKSLEN